MVIGPLYKMKRSDSVIKTLRCDDHGAGNILFLVKATLKTTSPQTKHKNKKHELKKFFGKSSRC